MHYYGEYYPRAFLCFGRCLLQFTSHNSWLIKYESFCAYDLQEDKSLQVLFHICLQFEGQVQWHTSWNKIGQSELQEDKLMRDCDKPDGVFSVFKWKRFWFLEIVFKPTSLKLVELNSNIIDSTGSGPEFDRKSIGIRPKVERLFYLRSSSLRFGKNAKNSANLSVSDKSLLFANEIRRTEFFGNPFKTAVFPVIGSLNIYFYPTVIWAVMGQSRR